MRERKRVLVDLRKTLLLLQKHMQICKLVFQTAKRIKIRRKEVNMYDKKKKSNAKTKKLTTAQKTLPKFLQKKIIKSKKKKA